MSTIVLSRLATAPRLASYGRELADPRWPGGPPMVISLADPKKHWLEALAAIIPGEALAAYTGFLSFFTVGGTGEATATLTREGWVQILSLVVLLSIPLVYAASSGRFTGKGHVWRWVFAMIAFLGWLWLLPLSVWDTLIELDKDIRAAIGLVAAMIILAAANYVFKRVPAVLEATPIETRAPGAVPRMEAEG